VLAALSRHRRNVTRAAKVLGVHRNTIHNRLTEWGEREGRRREGKV
jgi:DNA-binding PucR family transcriptional regulator